MPEIPNKIDDIASSKERISQDEVLRRREDIVQYAKRTYYEFCYNWDKAAQKAGFKDRNEADAYLSKLTGSKYGPDLKTGDRLTTPEGETVIYFKTAQELYNSIKDADDYESKGMIDQVKAHIEAEKIGFPLDILVPNRGLIYMDIVTHKLLEMKEGEVKTTTRAEYRKLGGHIYFNTAPREDEIWGSFEGGDAAFVRYQGQFLSAERDQYFYDTQSRANRPVFIHKKPDNSYLVFDTIGTLNVRLTNERNQSNK